MRNQMGPVPRLFVIVILYFKLQIGFIRLFTGKPSQIVHYTEL